MDIPTVPGAVYSVVAPTACTITDTATGRVLETTEPNKQKDFRAFGTVTTLSDPNAIYVAASTFNAAPTIGSGSGGGATIQFDNKPTAGSTNAVTSDGLFDILYSSTLALGIGASTQGNYCEALGQFAYAAGGGFAVGYSARAEGQGSIAINGQATKHRSISFNTKLQDASTCCIGINAWDAPNLSTLFYIVGASSPLANTYYGDENGQNGAAFLGYVVKEQNGNILECGTKKLRDLLNENTAWAPAALDLDAPAPTPFLPTGIMDPVELPEYLTE